MTDNHVGRTLDNRYRVLAAKGGDATTSLYRARDLGRGQVCTLKVLNPEGERDPRVIQRFVRQGRVLRQVKSPHVIGLLAEHVRAPPYYLVLEHQRSWALSAYLQLAQRCEPSFALGILWQVALGVQALHFQDVIHRALSPSVISITAEGVAFIHDLYVAKPIGDSGITRPRFSPPIQEPAYMAPEQTRAQADKRTDIYGLGATLYAMLTGAPPYTDRSLIQLSLSIELGQYTPIVQLQPGVPASVDLLVSDCMARAPADRPQSVGSLVQRMQSLSGVHIAGARELCDALERLPLDGDEPAAPAALVSERGIPYPLQVGNNLIGRRDPSRAIDPQVDLTEEENAKTVHRAHARVYAVDDRWMIAVGGQSVNRTLINGIRLRPGEKRPLADGDQIELGAVKLVLQLSP